MPLVALNAGSVSLGFGGVSLAHGPKDPSFQGGSVVTITNAPAYIASGFTDPAQPQQFQYTFLPVTNVSVSSGFTDPNAPRTPVTIQDGQANTVTVTPSP